jgi:hypothetical protein
MARDIDWPLFLISGGFLGAFLLAALIDIDTVSALVNTLFAWSTKAFGLYWQVLMLATFAVSLVIGFSRCGRVRLGGVDQRPDISTFNWIAVIMCALLAGGGAFWAAAEPLMHFASPPPCSPACNRTSEAAATAALAQSFVHWGFLAWAVLGSLLAIVLMHLHYDKGLLARAPCSTRCSASVALKGRSAPGRPARSSPWSPAPSARSVSSACRSAAPCAQCGACPTYRHPVADHRPGHGDVHRVLPGGAQGHPLRQRDQRLADVGLALFMVVFGRRCSSSAASRRPLPCMSSISSR